MSSGGGTWSGTAAGGPVVVAVDGSPGSHRAIRWAVAEAVTRRVPLELVHVYSLPVYGGSMMVPPLISAMDIEPAAKELLDAEVERARAGDPPVEVRGRLLQGPVVPELVRASAGACLLVSGTRGHGGLQRLGSTALHLAGHAHCPLVVVRGEDTAEGPELPPPGGSWSGRDRLVVVGHDGSAQSDGAARLAADEAHRHDARLLLVRGWVPPVLPWYEGLPGDASLLEDWDAAERRRLEQSTDALSDEWPDVPIEGRFLREHPVVALVAASAGADLLVVGSRGHGAFAGMLLGSVSQAVVREAHCSVMVSHLS